MNEKLNFHDLVGLLSEKAGITKKDAENFLRDFFDLTTNALLKDKQVKIKNLGTFKVVDVNERESVDVRTGERVVIPSHSKVSFAPDSTLSKTINEPFAMFQPVEIEDEVAEEIKPAKEAAPENITKPEEIQIPEEQIRKKGKVKKKVFFFVTSVAVVTFAVLFYVLKKDFVTEQFNYYAAKMTHKQEKKDVLKQIDDIKAENEIIAENVTESIPEDTIVDPKEETTISEIKPDTIALQAVNQTAEQPLASKKPEAAKKRTVAEGERLTVIALQEYGSKDFWVYLYEENKSIIKNPGNIMVGTKIIIPPASKYNIDKNNPESIKKAKELQNMYK